MYYHYTIECKVYSPSTYLFNFLKLLEDPFSTQCTRIFLIYKCCSNWLLAQAKMNIQYKFEKVMFKKCCNCFNVLKAIASARCYCLDALSKQRKNQNDTEFF